VSKKYVLELSAEELAGYDTTRMRAPVCSAEKRLYDLVDQARADREAEDMRLPWRVSERGDGQFSRRRSDPQA
jgi:hypothetical protein